MIKAGYKNIIHTAINSEKMFHYLKNKFRTILLIILIILLSTSTVGNQTFQIKLNRIGIQKNNIRDFYKNLNKETITLIKKNKISVCLSFRKIMQIICKALNKHKLKNPAEKIIFISMSKKISKIQEIRFQIFSPFKTYPARSHE